VLVLAILFSLFRVQKSRDWKRLLDTAAKNSEAAIKLARQTGFETSYGGNLTQERRLKLRIRQLTVAVVICVIIALALLGLAGIQTVSEAKTKTALLQQMTEQASKLQAELDQEATNRAMLIGDLGRLEGRTAAQSEQDGGVGGQKTREIADELKALRTRFTTSVDTKYLSQEEADELAAVDATLAVANGHYTDANRLLSNALVERLTTAAVLQSERAMRLGVMAIAVRMETRDFEGAIEAAAGVLKLQPGNWFALQQQAFAQFMLGHYEDAVHTIGAIDPEQQSDGSNWILPVDVAGTLKPDDVGASLRVNDSLNGMPFGQSFHLLGLIRWSDASPGCTLTAREEREQFARHWLAGELVTKNRAADAQMLLDDAVAVCANDPRILQDSSFNLVRLKRYEEAEGALTRLVGLDGSALNLMMLGIIQSKLSKQDEALVSLEKARTLAPSDPSVIQALADVYSDRGQHDSAVALLAACLKTQWEPSVAQRLENEYARLDRREDLIAIATNIIEREPNDASARFNRGLAYYRLGWYKPALDDFLVAASVEPTNDQYVFDVALAALQLGDAARAHEYADKVISQNAGFPGAYALRAQTLIGLKSYDAAVVDIDEMVRRTGQSVYADTLYYWAYAGAGRTKEAERYCMRLKTTKPLPDDAKTAIPKGCGGVWLPPHMAAAGKRS
jgi:tetratricopeptide (TPR) repeat protein